MYLTFRPLCLPPLGIHAWCFVCVCTFLMCWNLLMTPSLSSQACTLSFIAEASLSFWQLLQVQRSPTGETYPVLQSGQMAELRNVPISVASQQRAQEHLKYLPLSKCSWRKAVPCEEKTSFRNNTLEKTETSVMKLYKFTPTNDMATSNSFSYPLFGDMTTFSLGNAWLNSHVL